MLPHINRKKNCPLFAALPRPVHLDNELEQLFRNGVIELSAKGLPSPISLCPIKTAADAISRNSKEWQSLKTQYLNTQISQLPELGLGVPKHANLSRMTETWTSYDRKLKL